jgi:transcriptional regulator with XRE-family HTH domain
MPYQYVDNAIKRQIGERLRLERRKRGEKQDTVAAGTKISKSILSRIENGTYPFSLEKTLILINYYGLDINDVFHFES